MGDAEFSKYLIGQGGFALAFVVLFYFYRKDVKAYTDLWKSQTESLMQVVKENTTSNTRLIASNDSMQVLLAQMMRMVGGIAGPRRSNDPQIVADEVAEVNLRLPHDRRRDPR